MDTNKLIQNAINSVSKQLHNYQTSTDPKLQKKASILSYWLDDYMRMLKKEETFNPRKLKRYKRGEIVKVHLGYNIVNEEGGLHYAIVLTKNDSKNSPIITIIPLSSVKANKPIHPYNVFLGDTIFQQLKGKWEIHHDLIDQELTSQTQEVDSLRELISSKTEAELLEDHADIDKRIHELNASIAHLSKLSSRRDKISNEILKMKTGSIALVNQITTISKIRIYNPLHSNDVLGNVKVSNEILDAIDDKIRELYIGK